MRLLKISIFKTAVLMFLLFPGAGTAQHFNVQTGLYDYLDNVARDFYLFSPTALAGADIWGHQALSLNASAGFGFRSFRYNERKHHLYTLPVFITMNYDAGNRDSKYYPTFGAGFSLLGKADKNRSLEKTHYSFTYGYHFRGSFNYRTGGGTVLFIDILYNLLVYPAMEEINLMGVMPSVGLKFPLSSQ